MIEKRILVVGELNVDILLSNMDSLPVIGHEILADQMNLTLGSSSAIFAANLSAMGMPVSFCGLLGEDLFGNFIIEELKAKRVDTQWIVKSALHKTGLTIVMNYGQDRANVTHCGAMSHLTIEHIPLNHLKQFRHLHFSSFFLQDGLKKDIVSLFHTAHDSGLSTSLDLQWDPANKWDFPCKECLPYVDFFMPNEAELLALTQTTQLSDAFELLDPFVKTIIVKQGTSGATAYNKKTSITSKAFTHKNFVDAIGAGDSFNAGFLLSYLQGGSLERNLLWGNLAGAVNTTSKGGTSAFSDRASFDKTTKQLFNLDLKEL